MLNVGFAGRGRDGISALSGFQMVGELCNDGRTTKRQGEISAETDEMASSSILQLKQEAIEGEIFSNRNNQNQKPTSIFCLSSSFFSLPPFTLFLSTLKQFDYLCTKKQGAVR